ncbi:RrF2 family transcriptional regulator [Aestuariivirga sp.]|uniref:RrF2 family transcriptional regulator n=1 Tax=Aestuariivirga sp. TaxID=2650926 RepID=UPI003BAA0E8F
MRISTFSDYSLRVLIQAAVRHPQKVTIDEVAEAYGISRNHLIKVIHALGRAGFIVTQRGRSGGFTLARPAERISVAEVLKFGENDRPIAECFDAATNSCVITPACRLKGMLAEAQRGFYAVLAKYSLADVCAKPDALLRHLGLSAA